MTSPSRQLTLSWPHEPSFAREDFLSDPSNRTALETIERWPDWAARMLVLVGPSGAGKSHLGAIWARRAAATMIHGESLGEAAIETSQRASALLIDNADRIGDDETKLFHVINFMRQREAWLLLTARTAPDLWGLKTADLLSRLRSAPIVSLSEPDAELTEAVIFKLFSDRQLQVERSVVSYIALRIDRSLDVARALVAALDREALASGRKVTRVMAAEILRAMDSHGESP